MITPAEIQRIQDLLAAGYNRREIAELTGHSRETVGDVASGARARRDASRALRQAGFVNGREDVFHCDYEAVWQNTQLAVALRREARVQARAQRPHGDNLCVHLAFRPTGILWEEQGLVQRAARH